QNIPVLSQSNLSTNTFQYPLASPELDTGKLYAWQITAKNNISPVAKSEVWSFRVVKYGADSSVRASSKVYAPLRRTNDGSYVACNGVLRYEYLNELNDPSVALALWDISSARRQAVTLDSARQSLHYGHNYISLDVGGEQHLTNRHFYLLELTNSRQEVWYIKFEYHSN
ncbi:MAG TPA: hypothetical protein VLD19_11230, partial [Chitinophagaceae bacterium]|nr:hypothetical protein [Chitinophagaceae bacterium]